MKIGILTLPFNNNYGGYLQAYALMTVIKRMGHEVQLIYRQHNKKSIPLIYYVKWVIKKMIRRPTGPFYPSIENELRFKGRNILPFVDQNITPKSVPLYSTVQLESFIKESNFDIIICGSDQLWRPDYVPNVEDFFLSFMNDEGPKVISYAASFGTSEPLYTKAQKLECGKAILRFESVSLREQSGLDVIKRFGWLTKREPSVDVDPTLLLTREHYESLLDNKPSPARGKILCYVLDPSERAKKLISQVSELIELDNYHIIDSNKWKKIDYMLPSVEDWLTGFRDAEFVITDSFHGTVFSIIFNKPFVVLVNEERGSDRFDTLLNHFDLNMCRSTDYIKKGLQINWKDVNNLLNIKREKSMIYLKCNIGGGGNFTIVFVLGRSNSNIKAA